MTMQSFIPGRSVDYAKIRHTIVASTEQLEPYTANWVNPILDAIDAVNTQDKNVGLFQTYPDEMLRRWVPKEVGNMPAAWIERDVGFGALMQDPRTPEFQRRLREKTSWEFAEQIECSRSKVSRAISGKTKLSNAFAASVDRVARSGADGSASPLAA
jgi:hypothetical protein